MAQTKRFLDDSPERSYAGKLERFAVFAEPEMRRVFAGLQLPSKGVVLDLGCGTGHATALLAEKLGPDVEVLGLDLSFPHLQAARRLRGFSLVQADAEQTCFGDGVLDYIWSCNTINHLKNPVTGLRAWRRQLAEGGGLALAQSGFLPEMFFAWDAALDDAVRSACHRYYRERYGLEVSDTAGIRGLLGSLQAAGFKEIRAKTHVIERTQPLSGTDRDYFEKTVFEETWGERILPYLNPADREKLGRYCDPTSPDYCLDRPDFHHLQTVSVCEARE